jgi:hypothetical protein
MKRLVRTAAATLVLVAALVTGDVSSQGQEPPALQSHVAWVEAVMGRMATIQIGMTRADLLKVFTTEGGLSTGLSRTYVSRDCPYFKVDVEFEAVGRPDRNADGRVTLVEDPADRIVKMSRPYLQRVVMD